MAIYAKEYKDSFNLVDDDFTDIRLGEPFCVLDCQKEIQDAVFYYPLLNTENEFILLLTIIDTNNELQFCLDNELVSELNEIGYYYIDYVFYKSKDLIMANSSNNNCYMIVPYVSPTTDVNGYNEIRWDLISSINSMHAIDVDANIDNCEDGLALEKYSPSFSSNINDTDLKEKMLALHNPKGQDNFDRCWAASVATIVNYIHGGNITPAFVCDTMDIDYNEGGTIGEKQDALDHFNVPYNELRYSILTWTQIKNNIDNKKPVAMSAVSDSDDWHAVTLVGYRSFRINNYIAIWDSAANGNQGATKITSYLQSRTTFQSSASGPVFTWVYSLSDR